MAIKQFKARAHFPSLPEADRHQVVRVEAGSWAAGLGKIARQLKKLPALKKRRVRAMSIVMEQIGDAVEERGLQPDNRGEPANIAEVNELFANAEAAAASASVDDPQEEAMHRDPSNN